jgi:hypothetical protein
VGPTEPYSDDADELIAVLRTRDSRIADLLATLKIRDARILELLATIDLDESRITDLLAQLARSDDRVSELLEVIDLRDSQLVELAVEVEGLMASQEFRSIIEQAKGVIMSTMQCSADAAFAILVAQSSSQNRKVREIAVEIAALQDRRAPDRESGT